MEKKNCVDFFYSTQYGDMTLERLRGYCLHMICLAGECSFEHAGTVYTMSPNDVAIVTHNELLSELWRTPELQVEMFAAPQQYLNNLLPPNNWGIGGAVSLHGDPVLHLDERQASIFLDDIRHIRSRMGDGVWHRFYNEMMGGLTLTMMNDLFDFHSHREEPTQQTDSAAWLLSQLTLMLQAGRCRTHRSVSYYASELHVTPKYLSNTIKRITGQSVSSLIDRYTVPIVIEYLKMAHLPLQHIAEAMRFSSLSHFSRYVSHHLGVSPTQYRNNLTPRHS